MKRNTFALFCALALVLNGCSPATTPSKQTKDEQPGSEVTELGTSTDELSNTENETETDTQQTDTKNGSEDISDTSTEPVTVSFELASHTQWADGSDQELLYTEYERPTVTVHNNAEVTSQIMAAFTESENEFYASADNMYTSAAEYYTTEPDNFNPYYLDCTYEVERCDERILSMKQCNSTYSGGAHGDYGYTGLNFDISTGKMLTLDDISTDKEAFLKTAKSYILSQLELPRYKENLMDTPENLSSSIDEYILTDDAWYFSKSGITFVSNTYILAPYAAGAFFFTVPYQELDTLKAEYQYNGPFELAAPIGSTASANLDGNEDIDAIYYDCSVNWDTGELSTSFTINGTDYSSYLNNEDCMLTEGAYYPQDSQYYIIDIDASDEFREIAILDNGYSDDPITHFFRYDRGNLIYLGHVYDLLNSSTCYNNGDGTINANQLLDLLETAEISVIYELNGDNLELVEQEWYYVDEEYHPEEYKIHAILQDVTVYTENSRSSKTVTLTPQDGPVTFPATDDEHWFMIKMPNDQIYYLYLEDFSTLEDGRYATDVFENILLAG